MELLRVENVFKTYELGEVSVPVLKGVSFSIERGELVALMGASGSGKSTLMNILGCLDRPTSGKYWLDGREIGTLSADERAIVRTQKLGFVFQSFNLLPRTSALNNVLMPLDYSVSAPSSNVAMERAYDLLVRVGLADRIDHAPSKMSGGQQQRVAIARSLVNLPAVVLADEPTGNLDSHTSVEILEMFQELNAAGITVILVTHDPKVASYAHRTIRVVDGLIQEDAPAGPRAGKASKVGANGDAANGNGSNGNGSNGHVAAGDLASPQQEIASWEYSPAGLNVSTAERTATVPKVQPKVAPVSAAAAPAGDPAKPRPNLHVSLAATLFPPSLRTATSALRRNKMRSLLTALGIIIGVAAVIAMVEISQGSRASLAATMSTMGANNLVIQAGAASSGGISWGQGSKKTLTPDDAVQVDRQCPNVAAVAPIVQVQGQVVYGNRNWVPMSIIGTTPEYLIVRDWVGMEAGEMFTEQDVRGGRKVAVIGTTLARELFQGASPIGKDIRVKNVALRVIGVLSKKGANMMGMDQDDLLISPWTTIKYRVSGSNSGGSSAGTSASNTSTTNSLSDVYPGSTVLYPQKSETFEADHPQPVRFTHVDQILCKANSAATIPAAIAEITSLLHERHHMRADEEDDFNIRDMSEMLKAMSSMTEMMGALLMIVALISLVVGGVGIMNIMLVSVTERTREIGLRMAVGARGRQILRQFLIEAIVLCLFGGAVGIALGRGAALLVWYFMRWPIAVSYPAIAAAVIVSATVGIAFGFYPAWKASRLDPIEALRYE